MTSTDFSQSQRPWRILTWHTPSGRSKSSLATGKKSTAGRRGKKDGVKGEEGKRGTGKGKKILITHFLLTLSPFPFYPFSLFPHFFGTCSQPSRVILKNLSGGLSLS